MEDAWSHGRRDWGGGPPSPLPRLSQHASRGSGYIGQARPQDVTPSFEFVLSRLLSVEEKKKNVHNEKTVGLPGQCIECARRREFAEESTCGEDSCREADHTYV